MGRNARLLISLLLLTLGAPHVSAAAQTGPSVRTAVGYEFGVRISFVASIFASSDVVRAAVFYRPNGSPDTEILLADLSPGTPTLARAEEDLRAHPLPPFRTVEFWWQVDFADHTQLVTEHEALRYEDDRFVWQVLAEPPLAVHWVEGDLTFGQNALDAGASGINRIRSSFFLQPRRDIDIYLYPNSRELEAGLARTGRDWTAGHSDPALSVILLPVAVGPESALEFERLIPHELTHLLLYERMGETYSRLPTWLNEGLAVNMELSPDPRYRASLEAAASGEWLTWDSLCAAVPSSGSDALLVYAQSASLVGYLRDVYGAGSILALLDAYQEGASCTGAIERILRRSPVEFLREWQEFWSRSEAEPSPGIGAYGWLILAGLGTVGVGVGVFAWRKRRGSGLRGPPDSIKEPGPDS